MSRGFRRKSGPPPESRDPEQDALALLARRPFTRSELRDRLVERGHDSPAVDSVLSRLEEEGSLDDRKLASHFLLTRAERSHLGPRRLVADLTRRGVPPKVAQEALDELLDRGDLDLAELAAKAARRRVSAASGKLDRKRYAAVYNALFRAGFDPETIRVALEPHRSAAGGEDLSETMDDFP